MLPQTLAIPTILLVIFIFVLFTAVVHPKQRHGKNAPGPRALPIIGNLHVLGKLPHRTLQSLARKYGPIMSLKLGQVPAIVVSSAETAELFLKTHDTVFASRPKIQASESLSHGSKGLAFSEYSAYWRNVRKVSTLQLLSASKVEMFAPLRREELGLLVKSLRNAEASREVVDLSQLLGELMENIVYKMILGRARDDRFDLKGLVHEVMNLVGAFNLADYMPWLGAFDPQGLTKRLKKASKAFDQVLEQIIQDHEHPYYKEQKDSRNKDFVDILLSLMHQPIDLQDDQKVIDRTNIKAIILDMITAAFDTSSTTVEWAMSELLRHPSVMKRLQDELENAVGMNRHVEEIDLEKLPYLNMVVKETLRLHPVAPLLLPRECREDVTIDGYYIKEKSRIIINAWAIGRDPKVWYNAEMFDPKRFANSNVDIRGNDFRVIPFGSGRRGCPGIHLGLATVKLVLAQLVHSFNWVLPLGMSPDELEMHEIFGLTTPRRKHLLAIPVYRLLGQVQAIVVSSPETAELFLKTHDTVFASRPKLQVSECLSHGSKGLGFSEYSAYWRNVRKLCTLQLLSASKVEMFAPLRRGELGLLVKSLKNAAASHEVVDLSELLKELMENIVYKMILGCAKDDRFDLKGHMHEAMNLAGAFNLADYMPWLGMFDPQGLTRRLKKTSKAFDQVLEQIIQDHEHPFYREQKDPQNKDFVDILLSLMHQPINLQDDQKVIDRTNIKAIILDMITAAFDTSSTTVEWAMSELLKHPNAMKRLQDELENAVGMNRQVEESDLEKLPYLTMVVKETLRLHPVAPLLLPRECREDITIDGYSIKKKSRIIINAWAIGRDPKVWYNAEMFNPRRFENRNIDVRGNDFRVIPFGSGRRGCPGIHLGLTTVKVVLAQLVHCFNWVLPLGMSPDELDMHEIFGLTTRRRKHLLAVPVYRLVG
ncbi:steroid 17alpha-monooxygenase or 17alpha-hydroxyprogesterone aldolase [Spatholobus suberectus]|nr:steroid 17alpha-monooxygenase or 17alpha-hydroxyprogesterone aldolase [Spatholobus suberectus]